MAPFGAGSSAVTFSAAAVVLASAVAFAHLKGAAAPSAQPRPSEANRRRSARPNSEVAGAKEEACFRRRGRLAWLSAGLIALAVELWELAQRPRHLHPTLSSLANEVLGPGHRVVRAMAFVCWGTAGLVLASPPKHRA
jgi:hypothetical protein